jgi:hypothetical protein
MRSGPQERCGVKDADADAGAACECGAANVFDLGCFVGGEGGGKKESRMLIGPLVYALSRLCA